MPEPKRRSLAEIQARTQAMAEQVVSKDLISLLYGTYGVGKTVLTMAIAQAIRGDQDYEILYLDSSDGFVTLEDWPSLMEGVQRYRVDDYRDLATIGDAIQSRKKGWVYGTTVMDELSSWYQDMLHAYVREDEGLGPDDPLPEIEGKQYGPPTHALLDIVSRFHKTEGMHLLLTSHEQERGNEGSKRAEPSLPPKFLSGINQKMHLVARVEGVLRTDGYKRSVTTQPTRRVAAKSRISTLAPVEAFESIPELIADWLGGATVEHDLTAPESNTIYEDEDVQPEEVELDDEVPVEV